MVDITTAYVFRDVRFVTGSEAVVCLVEKTVVEAAIGAQRLRAAFGGGAVYTNDAENIDYVGVWGARNASRLRTLLRSFGVEFASNGHVRLEQDFATLAMPAIPRDVADGLAGQI